MEKYCIEKISLYKLFFTAIITAFYGVTGWFFVNRNLIDFKDKLTVISVIIFLIIAGAITIYKTRCYIDILKDED